MAMDDPCLASPAQPAEVASALDDAGIHVWWLPHRREHRRKPLLDVLAGYLDTRPDAITLDENAHGRPMLAGTLAGRLDFNWSHSGGRAVIAVARDVPSLGVDMEHIRPRHSFMALARRFYAESEYDLLAALPEDQRASAFVQLWTAKEAILKAHGRGLAYGLDKVILTLGDGRPRLVHLEGNLGEPATWRICHWALSGHGFATLCWQSATRRIRIRHFTLQQP